MEEKKKLITGVMYKNRYKDKDSKPDIVGKIEIQEDLPKGSVIRLACWVKEAKGKKVMSLYSDTFIEDNN